MLYLAMKAFYPAKPPFSFLHVYTPLEEADRRDVKGLYKKARTGELKNFTGIDSPYQPPADPEITVNTVELSVEETADAVLSFLESREQVGFRSNTRQLG